MRIIVDLIHPANIHYFKYFINIMKSKNHDILITARDKDVLQQLLNAYQLSYISTGRGTIGTGAIIGKALYLLITTVPDYVLSFGSTPCAVASYLLRIPHISFEDTEHAKLNRKLYKPFTNFILTPSSFYENIGKNHFRFNAYMESFYLHKNRFTPNPNVLNQLNIPPHEKFIFLRFVSWEAFHDIGQKKINLVYELKNYCKVLISSEGAIPEKLKEFEIKVSPEKIHDVLAYAALYIGEGGTMASECALLGVPAIYINSLPLMGYLDDERKAGLLFYLHNQHDILTKAIKILSGGIDYMRLRDKLLEDKIDPTAFLVWLIENYPQSKKILQKNPEYQSKFR